MVADWAPHQAQFATRRSRVRFSVLVDIAASLLSSSMGLRRHIPDGSLGCGRAVARPTDRRSCCAIDDSRPDGMSRPLGTLDTGVDQGSDEPLRCRRAGAVAAVDGSHAGAGDRPGEGKLALVGDDVVVVCGDDGGRDGRVENPWPRVEAADRPPGLDDLGPVVARDLVESPP